MLQAIFGTLFYALPKQRQRLAYENYSILKENPKHRSLHFKSVLNGKYRTVRIGIHYRAIGIPVPDGVQWFWIGSHAEYDKLLG